MNRRTALWLTTLLSGGLLPTTLLAQEPGRRSSGSGSSSGPSSSNRPGFRRPTRIAGDVDPEEIPPADGFEADPAATQTPPAGDQAPPELSLDEPGHIWRTFDIQKYTRLPHSADTQNPQNAITEWIFRRTGSAIWHGDRLAVLSAGRDAIRAYHNPKVLRAVEDMVLRFVDQERADLLKVRVRYIAAADPRWRYAVYTRLSPRASGSQGQQVWTLSLEDAAMVRTQLMVYQGFQPLAEKTFTMVNGQTLVMETTKPVEYTSGPQRDTTLGQGFLPSVSKLREGVSLRMSPLLNYDGDRIDLAIDLQATTVKRLIPTKILTPREIGPPDMSIDVPEVTHSRFNQTILDWPLGQSLLISAGIEPGILLDKGGFLNLRIPGTVPTTTELLVFIDAEAVASNSAPRTARGRLDEAEF